MHEQHQMMIPCIQCLAISSAVTHACVAMDCTVQVRILCLVLELEIEDPERIGAYLLHCS